MSEKTQISWNGLSRLVGLGGSVTGPKPLAGWLVTSLETFKVSQGAYRLQTSLNALLLHEHLERCPEYGAQQRTTCSSFQTETLGCWSLRLAERRQWGRHRMNIHIAEALSELRGTSCAFRATLARPRLELRASSRESPTPPTSSTLRAKFGRPLDPLELLPATSSVSSDLPEPECASLVSEDFKYTIPATAPAYPSPLHVAQSTFTQESTEVLGTLVLAATTRLTGRIFPIRDPVTTIASRRILKSLSFSSGLTSFSLSLTSSPEVKTLRRRSQTRRSSMVFSLKPIGPVNRGGVLVFNPRTTKTIPSGFA
ncbi:hypothetical protein FB451DRAFT_1177780 [Mycena latifolia]|nr:hypothetical protein FB451DRAFT_1177780 [Mycena latifolia]